ncbi:MAG: hypothetical protein ACRYFS_20190 [Janthinobacterium lividum]
MTMIAFEIADDQAAKYSEMACQMNMTLEEFALMRFIDPNEIDDEFVHLVNEIIEEDRELLESLA